MKKRILGGAIVLIVLITSILLGDIPFAITISLVALLGLKELIDIKYKNKDIKAIKILSSISMLLILLKMKQAQMWRKQLLKLLKPLGL